MINRRRALMAQNKPVSPYQHGTWDDLIWHLDAGDYATAYSLGETISLNLGTEGTIPMMVAKFNADVLESDETVHSRVTMCATKTVENSKTYGGTTSSGGKPNWSSSNVRTYCNGTLYNSIPQAVRSRIVSVKKYTKVCDASDNLTNNYVTYDKVFIPSAYEASMGIESSGYQYTQAYGDATKRTLTPPSSTTAVNWSTRSAYSASYYRSVGTSGSGSTKAPNASLRYPICFCLY